MIVVLSGPSGVGKTTIAKGVMKRRPELSFGISHTTRPPRGDERDGVEYTFVSAGQFARMVAEDAFAEYADVFTNRYGTARSTLDSLQEQGRTPLLDIDYQGAEQMMARYPHDAVTILLAPPSIQALEARLRGRATDTSDQLAIRLSKARLELSHFRSFQYVVVNDDIDSAVGQVTAIIVAEESRVTRREALLKKLLDI